MNTRTSNFISGAAAGLFVVVCAYAYGVPVTSAAATSRTLAITGFEQIRLEDKALPQVVVNSTVVTNEGQPVLSAGDVMSAATVTNATPACSDACMASIERMRTQTVAPRIALYGDYGPHVARIQRLLNAHGAQLLETGYYGPATQQAVLALQKSHGILQTGNVGSKTLAVLTSEGFDAEKFPVVSSTQPNVTEVSRTISRDASEVGEAAGAVTSDIQGFVDSTHARYPWLWLAAAVALLALFWAIGRRRNTAATLALALMISAVYSAEVLAETTTALF